MRERKDSGGVVSFAEFYCDMLERLWGEHGVHVKCAACFKNKKERKISLERCQTILSECLEGK